MKRWRQYLSSLTVVAFFVVLAGAAFAAEGLLESPDPAGSPAAGETVTAPVEPSAKTTEAPKPAKPVKPVKKKESEADGPANKSEADGPADGSENHGHCVSKWVHEAKSQGLKGRAKGQFVSSIARDKTAIGSGCDFQGQLSSALEEDSSQTKHSRKAKAKRH